MHPSWQTTFKHEKIFPFLVKKLHFSNYGHQLNFAARNTHMCLTFRNQKIFGFENCGYLRSHIPVCSILTSKDNHKFTSYIGHSCVEWANVTENVTCFIYCQELYPFIRRRHRSKKHLKLENLEIIWKLHFAQNFWWQVSSFVSLVSFGFGVKIGSDSLNLSVWLTISRLP